MGCFSKILCVVQSNPGCAWYAAQLRKYTGRKEGIVVLEERAFRTV